MATKKEAKLKFEEFCLTPTPQPGGAVFLLAWLRHLAASFTVFLMSPVFGVEDQSIYKKENYASRIQKAA
jgi:hypothetical protein